MNEKTKEILSVWFYQIKYFQTVTHLFFRPNPQQQILEHPTEPAFACSELTIKTLEKGVKYVQN